VVSFTFIELPAESHCEQEIADRDARDIEHSDEDLVDRCKLTIMIKSYLCLSIRDFEMLILGYNLFDR
jgi:hypothetical protein